MTHLHAYAAIPRKTVWLVNSGEQLPIDNRRRDGQQSSEVRLLRMGILARHLGELGHDVVWWSSSFNHQQRIHRDTVDSNQRITDRLELQLLHAPGYRRSIGARRFINHRIVSAKFSAHARRRPPPDVILASMPTIELASAACAYGAGVGVPVALDIRDLWPDHVVHRVPALLQTAVRLGFAPYRRELAIALRRAQAVYGITEPYLRWGLDLAGRTRRPTDHVFPLANDWRTSTPAELDVGRGFWRSLGVHPSSAELTCCFFGQMSRNLPLADVISAAKILKERGSAVKMLLIGDGPLKARWQAMAQNNSDIVMSGWLGRTELEAAAAISDVGLAPYVSEAHFSDNLPNKILEYFSYGLPVATTIGGQLRTLLRQEDCGWQYPEGDPTTLADQLAGVARDRLRLAAMSRNARELHLRRFRGDRIYEQMSAALLGLCRPKGRFTKKSSVSAVPRAL